LDSVPFFFFDCAWSVKYSLQTVDSHPVWFFTPFSLPSRISPEKLFDPLLFPFSDPSCLFSYRCPLLVLHRPMLCTSPTQALLRTRRDVNLRPFPLFPSVCLPDHPLVFSVRHQSPVPIPNSISCQLRKLGSLGWSLPRHTWFRLYPSLWRSGIPSSCHFHPIPPSLIQV